MAHVDDQRVARVLDALEAQHPGAQLLVNDPWSIYYLTGFMPICSSGFAACCSHAIASP